MEKVLWLLKSHAEPWLSFCSVYLDTVPSCIFLIVVGLLLLYLCHLRLPTKDRGGATRRRKGGTFRGWRPHRREAEERRKREKERRKLSYILKSSLGHHHGSTPFRHMLCPDLSCEVCNRTTAEIQQLLLQGSLQDAASLECFSPSSDSMIESSVSLSSNLSAIALGDPVLSLVPESSPPPCSAVSSNEATSFEDLISPSKLGDFLPPEPTLHPDFSFPEGYFPLQPLGIPSSPPPHSSGTVTQGDSLSGPSTHVPKNKDTHSPNLAALEIWHQAHTKDLSTPNLAQGDAKQSILALHSPKESTGVDSAANILGTGNLLFISPDALALLERQVKKRGDSLIHSKQKNKTGSFPKQARPDFLLQSSGKMLQSIPDKNDSAIPLPFWSRKDKPQELHMHRQPPYPKTFEDHLQEKRIQLSWDHPALQHNFLCPAGLVSDGCSSTFIIFSSVYDTSTAQGSSALPAPQAQESTALPTIQAQESTALPTIQAQESTALPTIQAQESTALPAPQAQESTALPAPQAQESTALPVPQAQESSALPVPQAQESTALPTIQAQEPPALPAPQAQESTALPTIQAQESTALPTIQAQESTALPTIQAQESTALPTIQAQESTALPVPQAQESSALPTIQAQESSALPVPQAQEPPALPVPQAQESSALPVPQAQEPQALPVPQAQESTALPTIQAQESTVLPAPQAQESTVLPAPQAQESTALPTIQAQESTALPTIQAQESTALPTIQAQESTALPTIQAQESTALPTIQAQESTALPTIQAQESTALPTIQAQESTALPTIQAQESTALPTIQAQESTALPVPQAQEPPALPVPQAQESSALPVPQAQESSALPVPQALEPPALPAPQAQKFLVFPAPQAQRYLVFPAPQAQESPAFPKPQPLLEPEIQTQLLSQAVPQPQSQLLREDQPQSFLPILLPLPPPQKNTCGVHFLGLQNEAESLTPSEIQYLEHHLLKKKHENLWGIPSVVLMSQGAFCPPAPNLALASQRFKAHVPISILPGDFRLSSEVQEKLEHHLQNRIMQNQCGLPRRVCESLSRVNIRSDISRTPKSKSHRGPSGAYLFKDHSIRYAKDLRLSQPGSFSKKTLEMLPLGNDVRKSQGHFRDSGSRSHLMSDSERCSGEGLWYDSEEDPAGHLMCLSGDNSRASGISRNQKKLTNALEAHFNKKVVEIHESHIPRTVYNSLYSTRQPWPLPEKSCSQVDSKDLAPVASVDSNINTSCELSFLGSSQQKMLEDHIQNYLERIMWGLPEKVLETIEFFKMKEEPSQSVCPPNLPSSTSFIPMANSQVGVSRPVRGSSMFLHGDKVRRKTSVPSRDHHFRVTSPVCKPYRRGSLALHGDKVRTRISFPCLERQPPASSPVCRPSGGGARVFHGDNVRARISFPCLEQQSPASSPVCRPCGGSPIALHGDNVRARISFPCLEQQSPASSPVCRPCGGSPIALHGENVRARISFPCLEQQSPSSSPVCKPCGGSPIALHGDNVRARISFPCLEQQSPSSSPVCRPCGGSPIALHGDNVRARISFPCLEQQSPASSPVCRPCGGSPIALHRDNVRARISFPCLEQQSPASSPVCKPCGGSPIALHGDNVRARISFPCLEQQSPASSPVCRPCGGSPIALHEDKVRTRISVPSLDQHFPSTSPVPQGTLRQTPCDSPHGRIDNIQRFKDCRQPCVDNITDKARQKQAALGNRCSPVVFTREDRAGSKPSCKQWNSRKRIKRLQGKKMNLEHFPMRKKSRGILISRELCVLPSPCSYILASNKSEISPMTGVTSGKVGATLPTEHSPPISESLDPKLSLLCDLESREHRQACSHPTDPSVASEDLKSKPVLTHARGICTWHTAPSQVLHVHVDDAAIHREQMQEPCVPVCALWKDQDKNLTPGSKTVSLPEPQTEELGGGDAGPGSSQPRRRIHGAPDGTLKANLGSKSSPTLSVEGQPPTESHFRKQIKHFLQWIWPSRKREEPESFLGKGSTLSSVQRMGLAKNLAAFTWNSEPQQVKTASGNVPGEKLGLDPRTGKTNHQEPLSTQVKFGKTQHQAKLQTRVVPVQGHQSNQRTTSCKGTSIKSCSQEAAFAGQSYPARNAHRKHRESQKSVPVKDQPWYQRPPLAVSQRKPVPRPSPT
ncbi:spermatogenesis-associated protein 31D1 [Oryctolagus cuniculus]|uniref:spermatogenesis-associated protein 31D1 n=1 Tax=Oryctolagus cuniculus TaxID=9986 RepID=UPI003879FCA6